VRSVLVTVAVVGVALVLGTGVAAAHGGAGGEEQPTTNYRTTITGFDPPPGVMLRVIDAGLRLELENTSGKEVVIMGYEDEPFLRVGTDGVYENLQSPATYVNATREGGIPPPEGIDADGPPKWNRVSDGPVARWHDHRAHWMGGTPAVVLADPDREHVINDRWVVPIRIEDQIADATGTTVWVPGPTGLAWFAAVVGIAAIVAGLALTRVRDKSIMVAATALVAVCVIDAVGTWGSTSDAGFLKVAALITPALGVTFVLVGVLLLRWRRREALVLLAGGAAGLLVLFGWDSRGFLTESQIRHRWTRRSPVPASGWPSGSVRVCCSPGSSACGPISNRCGHDRPPAVVPGPPGPRLQASWTRLSPGYGFGAAPGRLAAPAANATAHGIMSG
jgi:hypothetical protein